MARPGDKTVLVVDDEEDVREFLSTVLEDAGFNVVTAADGIEALERVREKIPDFISLDLVMPRKSGIKFLYELRHNDEWLKIPVVIVTAHAHDDLGKKDFQNIFAGKSLTGPNVYLEKPVNPDSYLRLVCEKLGVEYEGDAGAADAVRLKSEVEQLIQDADPAELSEILRKLKSKENRKG